MVMLISLETIFVWWYHRFVSKTTAIKKYNVLIQKIENKIYISDLKDNFINYLI